MTRKTPLALGATPLLLAFALAPSAQAQDDIDRFAVVGSWHHLEPTSDTGTLTGMDAETPGDGTATLGLSFFITDAIAIEAWGSVDPFDHDVAFAGGRERGFNVDQQVAALSAQYHFDISDTFRPFVGLGYHRTNFSGESAFDDGPLAGSRVGIGDAEGAMGTVGVDFLTGEHWFARTDLRYLQSDAGVFVDDTYVGDADIDPWIVGVGLGARF